MTAAEDVMKFLDQRLPEPMPPQARIAAPPCFAGTKLADAIEAWNAALDEADAARATAVAAVARMKLAANDIMAAFADVAFEQMTDETVRQ